VLAVVFLFVYTFRHVPESCSCATEYYVKFTQIGKTEPNLFFKSITENVKMCCPHMIFLQIISAEFCYFCLFNTQVFNIIGILIFCVLLWCLFSVVSCCESCYTGANLP